MSLYEEWKQLAENQSKETFDEFWEKYSAAEVKIYGGMLASPDVKISGAFSELVSKYDVEETLFMGFLDGINSSLKTPLDIESIEAGTELVLDPDFETLYFNMLKAEAEHLFTLPEWDALLDDGKRAEITKNYKRSKIYIKEKTPGRNDPCPCGSGKKYKKCCGA